VTYRVSRVEGSRGLRGPDDCGGHRSTAWDILNVCPGTRSTRGDTAGGNRIAQLDDLGAGLFQLLLSPRVEETGREAGKNGQEEHQSLHGWYSPPGTRKA